MANTTPKEQKEIDRNRALSDKRKAGGAPWGLKVNKKKDRIKVEHNYKTGEHKETNIDAMNRKPKRQGTSDGYMAGAK
jgi:hypothetical protein